MLCFFFYFHHKNGVSKDMKNSTSIYISNCAQALSTITILKAENRLHAVRQGNLPLIEGNFEKQCTENEMMLKYIDKMIKSWKSEELTFNKNFVQTNKWNLPRKRYCKCKRKSNSGRDERMKGKGGEGNVKEKPKHENVDSVAQQFSSIISIIRNSLRKILYSIECSTACDVSFHSIPFSIQHTKW